MTAPIKPPTACPTCRRAAVAAKAGNAAFPFCSTRCQMADLGRWLAEDYKLPDDGPPPDPDTAS